MEFIKLATIIVITIIVYYYFQKKDKKIDTRSIDSHTLLLELIDVYAEYYNRYIKYLTIALMSLFGYCILFDNEFTSSAIIITVFYFIIILIIYITKFFRNKKVKKLKALCLKKSYSSLLAVNDDNRIIVNVDEVKFKIPQIFLPYSVTKCVEIINGI
ncbi:MAG TPA: hypothetical protein DCQ29_07145 [Chitinophagaceae bacterium]|nr:hypothetical protein [Chitinophagaceae bacterium]